MTNWKRWFEDKKLLSINVDGLDPNNAARCYFWESMYQAFKARMLEEMRDEEAGVWSEVLQSITVNVTKDRSNVKLPKDFK